MVHRRVYREFLTDIPVVDTAAGDSVLRLALGLWAADSKSNITDVQRRWVIQRLQVVEEGWQQFSAGEKARLKAPLLAYIQEHHAGILAIVARQFATEEG